MDDLLATEFQQQREQRIHKIRAAIKAIVNGAENVSTKQRRQIHVRLNRARQAATNGSHSDCPNVIE